MNLAVETRGLALGDRLQRLEQLDFAPVRLMLRQAPPTGFGWSEETSLDAEKLYRQFLHLNIVGAVQRPVPCVLVDAFWHAHILDTKRYREDCESVFGYFLDHNPGFGAMGDAEERDQAFAETVAAGHAIFGDKDGQAQGPGLRAGMCGFSISEAAMCGSSVALRMGLASMCGSSIAAAAMCGSSAPRN